MNKIQLNNDKRSSHKKHQRDLQRYYINSLLISIPVHVYLDLIKKIDVIIKRLKCLNSERIMGRSDGLCR